MREEIMNKVQQVLFPELEEYVCGPQKYFIGHETGVLYRLWGSDHGEPVIDHAIPEIDPRGRERGAALKVTGKRDGFDMSAYAHACFNMRAVCDQDIQYISSAEDFIALASNPFISQVLQEISFTDDEHRYLVDNCGLIEGNLHMEREYYD